MCLFGNDGLSVHSYGNVTAPAVSSIWNNTVSLFGFIIIIYTVFVAFYWLYDISDHHIFISASWSCGSFSLL